MPRYATTARTDLSSTRPAQPACQPCPEGCRDCYPAANGTSQGCWGHDCREGYEFEYRSAAALLCLALKA
jgi:hypothetical protein